MSYKNADDSGTEQPMPLPSLFCVTVVRIATDFSRLDSISTYHDGPKTPKHTSLGVRILWRLICFIDKGLRNGYENASLNWIDQKRTILSHLGVLLHSSC